MTQRVANFRRMKATRALRTSIEKKVVPQLGKLLDKPLPTRVLNSKVVQRLGDDALRAMGRLSDMADGTKLKDRVEELRTELEKVLHARMDDDAPKAAKAKGKNGAQKKKADAPKGPHGPAEQAPVSQNKQETDAPMPDVIRTTGGKTLPGAVARRAVKRGDNEFKSKKGKKNR